MNFTSKMAVFSTKKSDDHATCYINELIVLAGLFPGLAACCYNDQRIEARELYFKRTIEKFDREVLNVLLAPGPSSPDPGPGLNNYVCITTKS